MPGLGLSSPHTSSVGTGIGRSSGWGGIGNLMLPGEGNGLPGGTRSVPYSSASQAQALTVDDTPHEINVQQNPDIRRLLDDMRKYRGQLASGNDVDAINSMMRARDLASGMAKEWEGISAMHGFGPGSGAGALGLG